MCLPYKAADIFVLFHGLLSLLFVSLAFQKSQVLIQIYCIFLSYFLFRFMTSHVFPLPTRALLMPRLIFNVPLFLLRFLFLSHLGFILM